MRLERLVLYLTVFLLASSCASGTASTGPALVEFDPDGASLPSEYGRYDESTDTLVPTPLEWSLVTSAEPTDGTCGDELGWLWAHDSGDPRIWLFLCATPSVDDAQTIIDSVTLEQLFVVSLEGVYDAVPMSTQELDLHADHAQLACAWGSPDDCRGWIYLARYGGQVVNVQFASVGHGGILHEPAFVELIRSVDRQMASDTAPTP